MADSLQGKTVIVTGGAKNLGGAISRDLSTAGANIVIHFNRGEDARQAEETATAVRANGAQAVCVQADLTSQVGVDTVFSVAATEFGDLYGTINTVGRVLSAPVADTDETEFDRLFAVNAKAAYLVMKAAARQTVDGGKIVNFVTSLLAGYLPGYSAYAGSKASNEQFVRNISKELSGRGISINNIGPGPMDTPFYWDAVHEGETEFVTGMTMGNRLTAVEDIVPWVRFLLTDGAWASGQTFWINGAFATR